MSRASMPDSTGYASSRAQIVCPTHDVDTSIDFVVPVVDPVTGTRGSPADAKGIAFLMMFFCPPMMSKLSPTTKRATLADPLATHSWLSRVVWEKVVRYWKLVGTSVMTAV